VDVVIGTKEKIATLRAVLAPAGRAQKSVSLGLARLDGILAGGLRRGALHEILAPPSHEAAATGFVAGLAARLGGPVLWIAQDYTLLEHGVQAATGLLELGLDPARLVLLRVPDVASALRAAMDGLSCAALGAVVIELSGESKLLDLVAYRKLLLGAGESGVTLLLLRFSARPSIGVAETRWQVRAQPTGAGDHWGRPVFAVELQRNRAGPGGSWVLEWSCDDGVFRSTDCSAVVSAPSERSSAAALEEVSAA
jgi:protein ImuA